MRHTLALILLLAATVLLQGLRAQQTVPYTIDFDSMTAASQVTAQGFINAGCTISVSNNSYSCNGTKQLRLYGGGTLRNRVLVFPAFTQGIDSLTLVINTRPQTCTTAYSGWFDIGYVTNAADTSTFVALQSFHCTSFPNGCLLKECRFPSAPAGARIALRNRPNGSSYAWYVDDIEVLPTATLCHWPTAAGVVSLDPWSAVIAASDSTGSSTNFVLELDGADMGSFSGQTFVGSLAPNSEHTATVRSLCITDTSAHAQTFSFRTRCNSSEAAPFIDDMESYALRAVPDCYTVLASYTTSTNSYPCVFKTAASAHSDSSYIRFMGMNNVLVLPSIALDATQMHVSFYMKYASTAGGTLRVGVMSDPGDTTTFVPLYTISDYSNTYTKYEFWTDNVTTDSAYVAFFWNSSLANGTCLVDDIVVEAPVGCRTPNTTYIDSIDSTNVYLRWADVGLFVSTYTGYQLAYNTVDDTATATIIDNIYTNSHTITGLTPTTDYWFWVRTVCDDTTEWQPFGMAHTQCLSALPVPASITFGSGDVGHSPECWTPLLNGNNIRVADWSYYNNYGIELEFHTTYNQATAIAMPRIPLPADRMRIAVTCFIDDLEPGTLEVGYVTDLMSDSSFVTLDSITSNTSTTYTFDTDTVTADSLWVAFRSTSGGLQTGYAFISSISVVELPMCDSPSEVNIGYVDDESVTVVWNSTDASGYFVSISTEPSIDSAFATISTTDTTASFYGLIASTQYYVWVQSQCGADNSEWSTVLPFHTMCDNGFCTMTIQIVDNVYNGQLFDYMGIIGTVNGVQAVHVGGPGAAAVEEASIQVCSTDSVSFIWVDTSIYESFGVFSSMDYSITIGDGTVLASGTGTGKYDGMTLLSTTSPCPTCLQPQGLTVDTDLLTDSSVTVRWQGNIDATAWVVTIDSGTAVTVSDTSYTFTGLTGGLPYSISVATLCDENVMSRAATVRVLTPCTGTECEMQIDMWTDSHLNVLWGSGNAVELYKNNLLVATASVPNGQREETVYAGVCDGDTLSLRWHSGTNGYGEMCGFSIIAPGDDTVYTGIGMSYSDTVLGTAVVHCSGCTRPDSSTVSAIGETSATITWPNTGADRYLLTINDSVITVNDTSASVTGLQPSTRYVYYLRAACSDDSSLALAGSFYTACGARPLPYFEGFEAVTVGELTPCWSAPVQYPDFYGTTTPSVYSSTNNSYSGYRCLELAGSPSVWSMAISMPLTGVPVNELLVDFWLKGNWHTGFEAGITNADNSVFIPLVSAATTASLYMRYYFSTDTVTLTDSVYHFAIRYRSTSSLCEEILIDDLRVRQIPPCSDEFTTMTVSNISSDSATLGWAVSLAENNGAYYKVNLMDAFGAVTDTFVTTSTTMTLGGLVPHTTYSVCVYLVCSGGITAISDTVWFTTWSATIEPCIEPTIDSIVSGEDYITVYFNSDADSVELKIGSAGSIITDTVVTPDLTAFTFDGLTHSTSYSLGLRSICTDTTSEWHTLTVGTLIVECGVPSAVELVECGLTNATITWSAGDEEEAWNVNIYNGVYNQTYRSEAPAYTFTGLTAGVTYNVRVQALCGQHNDIPGQWSAPLTFSTNVCPPVTNVHIVSVTANNATVAWSDTANASLWQIEYGLRGFDRGEGLSATTSDNQYTMLDLDANTEYDVYVAAVCTDGILSAFSETVTFTTATNGIDVLVNNMQIAIHPNPARRDITIECSEPVEMSVCDISGRTVMAQSYIGTKAVIPIAILAPGAYFIRLVNDNGTTVRKLIVE